MADTKKAVWLGFRAPEGSLLARSRCPHDLSGCQSDKKALGISPSANSEALLVIYPILLHTSSNACHVRVIPFAVFASLSFYSKRDH